MNVSQLLDFLLMGFGAYFIIAVVIKPAIFWENRRMLQRRRLIGDRRTQILYGLMGVFMFGVGVLGRLGMLG